MKKFRFSAKGKGFYIALIVCVVAIGIGTWAMLSYKNTNNLLPADQPLVSEDVFNPKTPEPTATVAPKATTTPSATPKATPKSKPTSFMWPVSGNILLPYSVSALVYDPTMADWRTHSGLDIKSNLGTGVAAIADGTVAAVEKGGMAGTTVKIEHDGGLVSIYSNLAENVKVAIGAKLKKGDLIGSVGQTSVAEAGEEAHLHLAMTLNGNYVSPLDYLPS